MSRFRLGVPKIHKAKVVTPLSTPQVEPAGRADFEAVSAATAQIIQTAVTAEELGITENNLPNLQTTAITSAGLKAPKLPLYFRLQNYLIKPLEIRAWRRAVHKVLQRAQATKQTKSSAANSTDKPRILHDGDDIRLRPPRSRRRPSRADLINAESKLGSTIFGPIPAGHRREFFHDQENVWIWHEDWTDEYQRAWELTVRYEVRPSGVYKKLAAGRYVRLEGNELENFRQATHAYLALIKTRLYQTGAAYQIL